MGTCVRIVLVVLFCTFLLVKSKAIHTSGKLDFGDDSQVASFVKSEKKIPVKISRTLDAISSPSDVTSSVSCGPTGCNATNNNNSVQTEVLVHVQTKVNFDQSPEKKVLEDASDVPIVVGYRGSTLDNTPDEEHFRGNTPDTFNRRFGSDYTPFRPLYPDSSIPFGPAYNQRHGQSTETSYYDSSTYRPTSNRYYGSLVSSYGFYGSSSPPTRLPNPPNSYLGSSTARPLDFNSINPSLSVTVPDLNGRNYDYNYKDNGVELHIPYFEHTYNKHHFSEEPPPQSVWYGKSNVPNPVEFRNIPRSKWRPAFWNGGNNKYAFSNGGSNFVNPHPRNPTVSLYDQPVHHMNHGTECSCREQRTDRSDSSNLYAASSVNHRIARPSTDPGASINDKLGSFN